MQAAGIALQQVEKTETLGYELNIPSWTQESPGEQDVDQARGRLNGNVFKALPGYGTDNTSS